jgi:N-acetyl-beta-hexosaminidase
MSNMISGDEATATLVVQCERAGDPVPSLGENESYRLEITDKQARLEAPTIVGALRGLETVLQLLQGDRDGYYLPGISIQDQPRFPWRGLLIDVGRHYQPIEVLKRNLDAMAAVKLNVLHWHLTEDQGFRVESRKFPKLHTLGSDGLFYTQDQVRERFLQQRMTVDKFAQETTAALKEHTAEHPFPAFGTLNAYQWLIYVPLHTMRHDKQIAEVKATAGYPR